MATLCTEAAAANRAGIGIELPPSLVLSTRCTSPFLIASHDMRRPLYETLLNALRNDSFRFKASAARARR